MEQMIAPPSSRQTRIRPDIISDEFLAVLRRHGVVRAYLFGSIARHQERSDSDIDLLVTFDRTVSLLDVYALSEVLAQLSGRRVDLMTDLDPAFAPYITPTLVPLQL